MPEVEYTGWFSRLGKSLGGVVVGVILFIVAFPVLWWNEGNAVHAARTLAEGGKVCITADPAKVDTANDNQLVYVAGKTSTSETLTDPIFKVDAKALKLTRRVEIYQWTESSKSETKKKLGGGEEKITYYYHKKEWLSQPGAKSFKEDDGEYKGQVIQNVGTMPYEDIKEYAKDAKLGAYKLTSAQIDRLGQGKKIPLTDKMLGDLPSEIKDKLKLSPDGYFYLPYKKDGSPSAPEIGDVRISFSALDPDDASVIAKQANGGFEGWKSPAGGQTIEMVEPGIKSKESMFEAAVAANNMFTWILRLVGLIMMAAGIYLVFAPLVTFADVLPFLGNILGAGIGCAAVLIALPLTLITISIAWVAYRPIIGIPLLVVGVGMIVGGVIISRNRRAARDAQRMGQGPPGGFPPQRSY